MHPIEDLPAWLRRSVRPAPRQGVAARSQLSAETGSKRDESLPEAGQIKSRTGAGSRQRKPAAAPRLPAMAAKKVCRSDPRFGAVEVRTTTLANSGATSPGRRIQK
jgi:hypothetical protein